MGSPIVDALNRIDDLQIVNHSAGAVFVRHDSNGDVSVLAHTYNKNGETTIRVPVGTGHPGESISGTLRREMDEEVAAQRDDFGFRLIFPKPVYCQVFPDDRTGQLTHLKAFFALEITRGRHREWELIDDADGLNAERLGPLHWCEIEALLTLMREHTPRAHLFAVAATLLILAQADRAIRSRYWSTWRLWQRHAPQFRIENPAVTEYVSLRYPAQTKEVCLEQ